MTEPLVLDTLNDVLAALEKSPHTRVAEVGAFLSAAGTDEYETVQRILEEDRRHVAALADLLIALGGVPAPGTPDARAARLHYLDSHFLLQEVLQCKRRLLAVCESALGRLSKVPEAFELVSRLAASHREHLRWLEPYLAKTGTSPVGGA